MELKTRLFVSFAVILSLLALVATAKYEPSYKESRKDFKYSKEANVKLKKEDFVKKSGKENTDGRKEWISEPVHEKKFEKKYDKKFYSENNNGRDDYRPPKNYTTTSERLFRMQKIQNIWQKGQKTLNEAKLKALFHDLKTQDAQEVEFKKVKSQGKDKDGLKEAALRAQLSAIIERYGLLSSFPEHEVREEDALQIDRMFKDKKLNKLWSKIESAGLDEREMKIFKEELNHHQLKVDQYYAFVDNLHETREKTPEQENSVDHFLEDENVKGERDHKESNRQGGKPTKTKKVEATGAPSKDKDQKIDEIRIKHQELKENFDSLAEKVRAKLNEQEFENEKAIRLWDLAKKADFTKEELDSLRGELHHFEHRIKKLHFFTNELEQKENPDEAKPLKTKVAELQRKVEKNHDELRGKIARRSEL